MATHVMTNAPVRPTTRKKGNGQMTKEHVAHPASIEDAARLLQHGIVQSLSGLNKIEGDIVLLVRKTVSDALHTGGSAAGELVNVVHHVVTGAIGAVEQAGTGLTMSIKSVAKGIVMGVHDVGDDVVVASAEILRSVVKHAGAVGADIGATAKRAVDGVIEATAEIGGDVGKVGKRAIEGAIQVTVRAPSRKHRFRARARPFETQQGIPAADEPAAEGKKGVRQSAGTAMACQVCAANQACSNRRATR